MEGNSILLPLDAPAPETVARTLADSFGQERACDIYCEIARASYAAAKAVRGVRTVLSYLPNSRYPDLRWLDDEDPGFLAQKGATIGERFHNSAKWCLEAGSTGVLVLSPYAPGVPEQWLRDAFEKLKTTQLVIGPTGDGHCYLVAMSAQLPFLSEYPWEGRNTRDELVEHAKRMRIEPAILPEFYEVKDEASYRKWQASMGKGEAFPAPKPEPKRKS
ncbi:MAG: DUF2064 domain-containing protein [Elusimicrobia bacterium]|nr:DUF2064 domain-containing protein [Elusimicrobiota bacterium]